MLSKYMLPWAYFCSISACNEPIISSKLIVEYLFEELFVYSSRELYFCVYLSRELSVCVLYPRAIICRLFVQRNELISMLRHHYFWKKLAITSILCCILDCRLIVRRHELYLLRHQVVDCCFMCRELWSRVPMCYRKYLLRELWGRVISNYAPPCAL